MSCALSIFQTLTGCDTVSSFAGHGKETAWSTWKSLPELTDALLMPADGPDEILDDVMNTIERFVILLFDRTSTCTKVDHARRKIFPRKQLGAANHAYPNCSRGVCQESNLPGWSHLGETLLQDPVLPPPTDWGGGRQKDYMSHTGLHCQLPHASKSCHELISCGCKSGCRKRCRSKKAALPCTGLCFCEGECAS